MDGGLRTGAFALAVMLLAPWVCLAQDKALLKNEHKAGDGWHVELDMKLTGVIKLKDGEKSVNLSLKADAKHRFEERVLAVQDGKPSSVGRYYHEAKADVALQDKTINKSLRADRRLQGALLMSDQGTVAYCPSGPLTDEELELTGEHLDVLALHGVLPNREVAVGDTWEVPLPVAQALAGLDGVISSKLQCKFDKIDRNHALLALTGDIEGISKGGTLKAQIAAGLVYSLEHKRFTGCNWRHKESKEQGPLNPALDVETEIAATWRHGLALTELTDGKTATIPAQPTPALLLLEYRDPLNRFSFNYDRQWGIVTKNEKQTVLRLLERGELIAQLNISPAPAAKPGQHMGLEELHKLMAEAPGFKLEKELERVEIPAAPGFWIGKVSAAGEASELPMQQIVYAIAGPRGDQAILAFTVETDQSEKLAGRDLSLVKTFGLPTVQTTGGTK